MNAVYWLLTFAAVVWGAVGWMRLGSRDLDVVERDFDLSEARLQLEASEQARAVVEDELRQTRAALSSESRERWDMQRRLAAETGRVGS